MDRIMNSLDQRNRILHEIKLVVLGARFEVTKLI
jgi:hypothetical protein